MTMTTDIELLEASDISVDASVIDVSEVESDDDKAFLIEAGSRLLEVDAKAEYAIRKIVATIQGRASVEKGETVDRVQKHFEGRSVGGLKKFYASMGYTQQVADTWARAYRSISEFGEMFDGLVEPEKVLQCSDRFLATLDTLPREYKEKALADIAVDNPPTRQEVEELKRQPIVKLSKAEELLAKAHIRKDVADQKWEEVKSSDDVASNSPEYKAALQNAANAAESIKNYEQKILELKALVEEERLATKKEAETRATLEAEKAKMETELQKMKFDDASIRADRVKRVSNQLLVQVPAVLSELQKFYAEIEHYDNNTRDFLEEQFDLLTTYLKDHR